MDGLSVQAVARDGNFYVVYDGQIIHLPIATVDQVESERSISLPRILKTPPLTAEISTGFMLVKWFLKIMQLHKITVTYSYTE
jgi:hypothetical protein